VETKIQSNRKFYTLAMALLLWIRLMMVINQTYFKDSESGQILIGVGTVCWIIFFAIVTWNFCRSLKMSKVMSGINAFLFPFLPYTDIIYIGQFVYLNNLYKRKVPDHTQLSPTSYAA
jgi:hypothetical protein